MKSIQEMFPKASKSFIEANAPLSLHSEPIKTSSTASIGAGNGIRRGCMNKTEAQYAMILEAMKRKGEILRYEFEGITLRFANVKYTPDFVVFVRPRCHDNGCISTSIKLIEVKGPFIKGNRERAVERFRHAKTYWPEFSFEMHQKSKDGWKQVI